MKAKFLVIGSLLLVAIAACHPAKAPEPDADEHSPSMEEAASTAMPSPELAVIDSLTWALPDSAWVRLLAYLDDTCRGADSDRHFAHVLLAELLYKNDYAQTNREELQQAVDYYDSLTAGTGWADTRGVSQQDFFLAARAHYINGVGCYERDSIMQACQEYILALEIMEEYFDEKDLIGKKARFMALTYTHLTSLFSDQYLHEQAIYFGKKSLVYYQKYDAVPWHKAWMLNEIGTHYDMMDCYDSAAIYYHMGLSVLPDTNTLMYRDISALLAFLSYKKDKTLDFSQSQMRVLLSQAESEKEYLARCMIIGDIYYHEKQFDSAYVYFDKVFHHSQSVGARKQAAEWLIDICKTQARDSEILEYASFLVPFANQNENQGHLKSQLTKMFHDYERERLEIAHRKQLRKLGKYGGAALVVLAAIALLLLVFHFVNKKRYKHLRKQNEEKDRLLESERHAHKMIQAALAGRLKRSNETLRQTEQKLEDAIYSKNAFANGKTLLANMAAFKASPVCSHILEVVEDRNFKPKIEYVIYKDYALDKSQLKALVEAADEHLDHFTVRIRKVYPALNEDDVKYCCLFLLGLNEADISALMQRAYSTVCERNRKIKRIMGTKGELKVALMEWV